MISHNAYSFSMFSQCLIHILDIKHYICFPFVSVLCIVKKLTTSIKSWNLEKLPISWHRPIMIQIYLTIENIRKRILYYLEAYQNIKVNSIPLTFSTIISKFLYKIFHLIGTSKVVNPFIGVWGVTKIKPFYVYFLYCPYYSFQQWP